MKPIVVCSMSIVTMMYAAVFAAGCASDDAEGRDQEVTAEAVAAQVGGNFNVNIDVLGVANAIAGAVSSSQNRPGWVKNVMETAYNSAGRQYNVMVFNLNQEYTDSLNNVKFYGSAVYNGITYGIWIFESGTFENKGDGGWINWAFQGCFNRNGGHVEFTKC
jgi:hypothetical protein